MKDHRQVIRILDLDEFSQPLETVISKLREYAKGLINPQINIVQSYDYVEAQIRGWVPLTPEEISKEKIRAQRQRESAKKAHAKKKAQQKEKFLKEAKRLGYNVSEA